MRKIVVLLAATAVFSTTLTAQVMSDVVAVYNEGAKLAKTDLQASIKSFENVIVLADKVGDEANDLKQKAMKVIPQLYYTVAVNALNEKKPAQEIICASKTSIAIAEKYGNNTVKENSGKVLMKGYSKMASDFFAAEDLDNAIKAFDSVLMISPENVPVLYNKAMIYKKQNNYDQFGQTIDIYLEQLRKSNDTVNYKSDSAMALEFYRGAASKANQDGRYDEAIAMLDNASRYGEDKTVYYYYADIYNKQKDYDRGAEYAQKGLDIETGDDEAKARFWYQLAVAQAAKGQTTDACASFKKAEYGAFADASKAQRTNLKCSD